MVFYELSRTVRCCLPLGGDIESAIRQPRANTFAAWPSMVGLGLYVELVVCCRREADPVTGFVVSIADVDEAVRSAALPVIAAALRSGAAADAVHLLGEVTSAVACRLGDSVRSVTWNLTPHYHVTMEPADMTRVRLAQQFEFAAAHRLHNPQLDEETNRRVYGKCTNPNGHGHNYRLQVVASRPVDDGPSPFSLQELERIVDERIVERFDHTHLNLDTAEFAEVIPTVEHIARACFDLAAGPVAEAGGRLEEMTVWETDKTCCTYRGPAAGD